MHGSMAPATTNIISSANEVFNLEHVANYILILQINIYGESGILAERTTARTERTTARNVGTTHFVHSTLLHFSHRYE